MDTRIHGYPDSVQVYPDVTRITIVGPDGVEFEGYGIYPNGCEIHLQDDGKTLKVFPRMEARKP